MFFYFQSRSSPIFGGQIRSIPTLNRLNPLHNHCGRGATAVADCRNTVLANLELMQQRDKNAGPRATEGMAQRDGSAERVHIRTLQPQDLKRRG